MTTQTVKLFLAMIIMFPLLILFSIQTSLFLVQETRRSDCGKYQQDIVRESSQGIKLGLEKLLFQVMEKLLPPVRMIKA